MSIKKSWKQVERKRVFLFCLFSLLAWRLWLQVFLWLGWLVIPLGDNFLGGGLQHFLEHPGLWPWSNFDGEHYLAIAHNGYGKYEQAFFPFFPFLIKFIAGPFKENLFALLLSSLTISHFALFGSLVILYLLIKEDFDQRISLWSIFFLLAFPTSFFLISTYNESLFLFLVLSSFYAARKGRWWIAGICGVFASMTRLTGVLLLPALFMEWSIQQNINLLNKNELKDILFHFLKLSFSKFIPILIVPLGLIFYMHDLSVNYQDPLMFVHAQPVFGAQREVDKLILPYQVLWRYLKMISETKLNPLYFTVWLELMTSIGFFGLLIFAYLKKVRQSYLVFAFASYLLPTFTGTLLSMPRFVLVLFPGFIALALIKNVFLKALILGVSIILLIISTILFTRGYFVS
ncbi:MAG: hypothetical protein Q8Q24_01050 [bacterium]|nr:hypothetical protein [bacterium]